MGVRGTGKSVLRQQNSVPECTLLQQLALLRGESASGRGCQGAPGRGIFGAGQGPGVSAHLWLATSSACAPAENRQHVTATNTTARVRDGLLCWYINSRSTVSS